MAGLEALLQRIARSLEEAGAQQPGDDLRARLGYGTGEEAEEQETDSVWEPERGPETGREREAGRERDTARTPSPAWRPKTVWSQESPGRPAPPSATRRESGMHGARAAGRSPGGASGSRTTPPHAHASPAHALSERIRARLNTPDALREAFVVKEILDRPLARRRAR